MRDAASYMSTWITNCINSSLASVQLAILVGKCSGSFDCLGHLALLGSSAEPSDLLLISKRPHAEVIYSHLPTNAALDLAIYRGHVTRSANPQIPWAQAMVALGTSAC